MDIREYIEEYASDQDVWFADGFDEAILGIDPLSGKVVYSRRKCIEALIEEGMDFEDAIDFLEFNTFNAYIGENTPIFIDDLCLGL